MVKEYSVLMCLWYRLFINKGIWLQMIRGNILAQALNHTLLLSIPILLS